MSWPRDAPARFWGLLLLVCAVAAVIGSSMGQLLGLSVGLGVVAVLLSVTALVLIWWSHRHR
jgi:uncharacterized membrane-anchored protein